MASGPIWTRTGSKPGNRRTGIIGAPLGGPHPNPLPTGEEGARPRSDVWVGPLEDFGVAADAVFEGGELACVARGAEAVHAGFGEILVVPLERGGHGDELDPLRLAGSGADGAGEIGVGAGAAGAEVEQAARFGVIEQPEDHVDGVADPDEVALLLPVGEAGLGGAEQVG